MYKIRKEKPKIMDVALRRLAAVALFMSNNRLAPATQEQLDSEAEVIYPLLEDLLALDKDQIMALIMMCRVAPENHTAFLALANRVDNFTPLGAYISMCANIEAKSTTKTSFPAVVMFYHACTTGNDPTGNTYIDAIIDVHRRANIERRLL